MSGIWPESQESWPLGQNLVIELRPLWGLQILFYNLNLELCTDFKFPHISTNRDCCDLGKPKVWTKLAHSFPSYNMTPLFRSLFKTAPSWGLKKVGVLCVVMNVQIEVP